MKRCRSRDSECDLQNNVIEYEIVVQPGCDFLYVTESWAKTVQFSKSQLSKEVDRNFDLEIRFVAHKARCSLKIYIASTLVKVI